MTDGPFYPPQEWRDGGPLSGDWAADPTHHCHIVETGNESIRFSHGTAEAKKRIEAREQTRKGSKTEAEAKPF